MRVKGRRECASRAPMRDRNESGDGLTEKRDREKKGDGEKERERERGSVRER